MVPLDFLVVYQGSNYVSREIRDNLAASVVTVAEVPIEIPGSIGT